MENRRRIPPRSDHSALYLAFSSFYVYDYDEERKAAVDLMSRRPFPPLEIDPFLTHKEILSKFRPIAAVRKKDGGSSSSISDGQLNAE
jgi:hypothetical protein